MTEENTESKKESEKEGSSKNDKSTTWVISGVLILALIIFFSCRAPQELVSQENMTIENFSDNLTKAQNEIPQEPAVPVVPNKILLTDIFVSEDPAHCTFTFEGTEVEMYKDHDKFRQETEQDGIMITTLHNEGIMYLWTSDGAGKKVDLRALARSGFIDNIKDLPTQPSVEVMDKAKDVVCDSAIPADIFMPSKDIPFRDMNAELAAAVKEANENAAYRSEERR